MPFLTIIFIIHKTKSIRTYLYFKRSSIPQRALFNVAFLFVSIIVASNYPNFAIFAFRAMFNGKPLVLLAAYRAFGPHLLASGMVCNG